MNYLEEMLSFLQPGSRLDLNVVALTYVLSLTGSEDGKKLLITSDEALRTIMRLTDDSSEVIAKDATLSLINLSAEEKGAGALLRATNGEIVNVASKHIINPNSVAADAYCMVLNNLSRSTSYLDKILDTLAGSDNDESCIVRALENLLNCYTKIDYNTKNAKLHYLGTFFSNLSQSVRARLILGSAERTFLVRLLPFASHKDSIVRRGGAISLLRNLCFDKKRHPFLMGQTHEDMDVLPFILLPLAGPEEFDDEDNEKFPTELQYLGPEKVREEALDLRVMLLECLEQLCATRDVRNILRDKGVYEILREFHKWETQQVKESADCDRTALLACENVVDILIRTEDEIGLDDLSSIDIPEEYKSKFETEDKQFLEDK